MKSRRILWWVAGGVLGALAVAGAVVFLYVRMIGPHKAAARATLDDYVDARRRGVEPRQTTSALTPERDHADRILARSTSLDVEVGNWSLGSEGDWVCFEGHAQTPGGAAPLVVALSRSGDSWHVGPLVSRSGCECSSREGRIVDCP